MWLNQYIGFQESIAKGGTRAVCNAKVQRILKKYGNEHRVQQYTLVPLRLLGELEKLHPGLFTLQDAEFVAHHSLGVSKKAA